MWLSGTSAKFLGFRKPCHHIALMAWFQVFVGWKLPRESSDFRWFWGTGALVEVHANCIILEQKTENTDESCALANFHKKSLNQTSKNPSFPHLSYKFNDISRAIFCGDFLFKKTSILSQQALSSRLLDMSTEAALHIAMSSQGFLDMTSHQAATPWTWLWGFFFLHRWKNQVTFSSGKVGEVARLDRFFLAFSSATFLVICGCRKLLAFNKKLEPNKIPHQVEYSGTRKALLFLTSMFVSPPPFLSSLVWRPRKPFLVESSTGLNLGTGTAPSSWTFGKHVEELIVTKPSGHLISSGLKNMKRTSNPWYQTDQQFFKKWACNMKLMNYMKMCSKNNVNPGIIQMTSCTSEIHPMLHMTLKTPG